MTRSRLLALSLALLPVAAAAQVSNPPALSITLNGDVQGTPAANTAKKLNGNTPGGTCPSGQFQNGADTSARPTCAAPPPQALGIFAQGTGAAYVPYGYGAPGNGAAFGDSIHCYPFAITASSQTLSALEYRLTTSGGTGSLLGYAIYNAAGAPARPSGSPVVSALNLSTSGAAGVFAYTLGTATALPRGTYFVCAVQNNATAVLTGILPSPLVGALMGAAHASPYNLFSNSSLIYGISTPANPTFSGGTFAWGDLSSATWTESNTNSTMTPYLAFVFSAVTQ